MVSCRPTITPPMTSLWPDRYLVAECSTRSMPCAIGCWLTGVAKVESMIVRSRCRRAMSAMRSRSTTFMYGLVGDSLISTRVRGVTAASSAA